jgi:short-chain fatty acids transporter
MSMSTQHPPRFGIPDPFALTLGLAAVVIVAAAATSDLATVDVLRHFVRGMFVPAQLAFGFQMALILMSGMAIASAPPVQRMLSSVASLPLSLSSSSSSSSSAAAAALIALVSMSTALLNWGLSLVVGAILAKAMARALRAAGKPVPYAVFGGAAYTGLAVWHGGLSGSAPLAAAKTSSSFGEAIPVSMTTFSAENIIITLALVVALTAVAWHLGRRPDDGDGDGAVPDTNDDEKNDDDNGASVAGVVAAIAVAAAVAAVLGAVTVSAVVDAGSAAVTLDSFIVACLAAGMALHARRGVLSWGRAMQQSAGEVGGILLHFPFYFGVIAVATDGGLVEGIALAATDVIASGSGSGLTATIAALMTFVSAAIINLVVPSGGGQWAVQAPFLAASAQALHLDRAPLVMAFAYGDQLTNLLQPFWALPILSITGLKARALLPITARFMVVAALVTALGLAVLL